MIAFSCILSDMPFLHDIEEFSYDCGIIMHQQFLL
jgi:hypothetical protein